MTIDGTGGKYDAACELVLAMTGGTTTLVIVIGGVRGSGFSMSTRDPTQASVTVSVLRDVANQLEADMRKLSQ